MRSGPRSGPQGACALRWCCVGMHRDACASAHSFSREAFWRVYFCRGHFRFFLYVYGAVHLTRCACHTKHQPARKKRLRRQQIHAGSQTRRATCCRNGPVGQGRAPSSVVWPRFPGTPSFASPADVPFTRIDKIMLCRGVTVGLSAHIPRRTSAAGQVGSSFATPFPAGSSPLLLGITMLLSKI